MVLPMQISDVVNRSEMGLSLLSPIFTLTPQFYSTVTPNGHGAVREYRVISDGVAPLDGSEKCSSCSVFPLGNPNSCVSFTTQPHFCPVVAEGEQECLSPPQCSQGSDRLIGLFHLNVSSFSPQAENIYLVCPGRSRQFPLMSYIKQTSFLSSPNLVQTPLRYTLIQQRNQTDLSQEPMGGRLWPLDPIF